MWMCRSMSVIALCILECFSDVIPTPRRVTLVSFLSILLNATLWIRLCTPFHRFSTVQQTSATTFHNKHEHKDPWEWSASHSGSSSACWPFSPARPPGFPKTTPHSAILFSTSSMLSKFSTFDDSSCVGKPYVFNALYTVDKRARKPVLPVNGTKQYWNRFLK